MNERSKVKVFGDGEAKTFEISKETKDTSIFSKIPTIAAGKYAEEKSVYIDNNGNKAVIPTSWTVSGIQTENTIWGKNKGLVIYKIKKEEVASINWSDENQVEHIQATYDQMVWIPVNLLKNNGTLDGTTFTEKLGRRNYLNDKFTEATFHEDIDESLVKSVNKYGGFYISRYDISNQTGKPKSIRNAIPCINISYNNAKEIVRNMEIGEIISHIPYGAEFDSILEWLIETKTKTLEEISTDSTEWGNYWGAKSSPRNLMETGSRNKWSANNIFDIAGNISEMTQEKNNLVHCVIRGGYYNSTGKMEPVACRLINNPNSRHLDTGFREAIYLR